MNRNKPIQSREQPPFLNKTVFKLWDQLVGRLTASLLISVQILTLPSQQRLSDDNTHAGPRQLGPWLPSGAELPGETHLAWPGRLPIGSTASGLSLQEKQTEQTDRQTPANSRMNLVCFRKRGAVPPTWWRWGRWGCLVWGQRRSSASSAASGGNTHCGGPTGPASASLNYQQTKQKKKNIKIKPAEDKNYI